MNPGHTGLQSMPPKVLRRTIRRRHRAKLAFEGSCSALFLGEGSAGPLDDGDELILAMLFFVGTIIAEIQLVIDSIHVSSPSEALDGDTPLTDGVRQLMADGVSAYGI